MRKPDFISNYERYQLDCSRRTFLKRSFAGIGGMALSQLMGNSPASPALPFIQSKGGLHFPARAKRVVHLCMAGGPSHLESFDPKPKLDELHDKPFPESFTAGQQLAQLQGHKLIARGTVEEKILNLQRKKRELISATLTDEEALAGKLSWEDIQELLS